MKQDTLVWRKTLCIKHPCEEQEIFRMYPCLKCCWFCKELDVCISNWKKGKAYCIHENKERWCSGALNSYLQYFTQVKNRRRIILRTYKRINGGTRVQGEPR